MQVSCLMPTKNRRSFIRQALASFLAQEGVTAELLVLDDGTDGVADLMPNDSRVRYLYTPPMTLAEKRNYGIDLAHAPLIAMWDDDDVWRADRLRLQVAALAQKPQAEACLLRSMAFFDFLTQRYWLFSPDRAALLDNSVVMRKTGRRLDLNGDPITALVRYLSVSTHALLDDPYLGVSYLHGCNAGRRRVKSAYWTELDPPPANCTLNAVLPPRPRIL
jgi:glycosyltransferase involved in cell wall biosynthesis